MLVMIQNCLQALSRSLEPETYSGQEKLPFNSKKSWAGPGWYGGGKREGEEQIH